MQAAQTLLGVHAHNIANVSTEGFVTQAGEPPDLVSDVVGVLIASKMYTANAKVFAVMAETERALLDVRA